MCSKCMHAHIQGLLLSSLHVWISGSFLIQLLDQNTTWYTTNFNMISGNRKHKPAAYRVKLYMPRKERKWKLKSTIFLFLSGGGG